MHLPEPSPAAVSLRLMVLRLGTLLALSLLLALGFNRVHPLGIRPTTAAVAPPAPTADALISPMPAPPTSAATNAAPIYRNETISIRLITDSEAADVAPPERSELPPAPVTWAGANELVAAGQALLVDARSHAAFEAGHIPGAISLPVNSPAEVVAAFQRQYPLATPLIVYCGSATCPIADRLAERLIRGFGYRSVRVMPGGYQEWQLAQASAQTLTAR